MNIKVNVIPHNEQRYDTCGDWQFIGDDLVISVSKLENSDLESLVALHEIVEALLCRANLIKDEEVTAWDKAHTDHPSPGDIPNAPYYREHLIATIIERIIADEIGINWDFYEWVLEEL